MPWKEESVVSQRLRLIEQMLLPGADVSNLARTFGVSRKTAYKWLNEYNKGGLAALKDKNRSPITQPNRSSKRVEKVVIAAHKDFPYWGPYKLMQYIVNEKRLKKTPSHTTIGNILKRNGCEVINNNKSHPATRRFEREQPNDLWQMDFKGSFMTKEHRCFPLTIIDDFSRFSVGLKACLNERRDTVKSQLISIFKEFGTPCQINVDNGNPWGSTDLESLTSLHVWLIKQGIKLTHSAPYHPQTNGKNERFHRSLKLEVLHQRKYKNNREMQKAFNEWRHIYNFKRPHQGIENKTPGSRYKASYRKFQENLSDYDYANCEVVKKVSKLNGFFSFKGKRYRAGKALNNEYIAIKETDRSDQFAIYFMDSFIKKFDLKESV